MCYEGVDHFYPLVECTGVLTLLFVHMTMGHAFLTFGRSMEPGSLTTHKCPGRLYTVLLGVFYESLTVPQIALQILAQGSNMKHLE